MRLTTGCPSSLVLEPLSAGDFFRMWNVFLVESCQIPESSLHVSVRTLYESPSPWQTYCTQPSDSHQCTPEWQHQTRRHHCFLLVLRKTWEGKDLIATNMWCFIWLPGYKQNLWWGSQVRQGREAVRNKWLSCLYLWTDDCLLLVSLLLPLICNRQKI